MMKRYTLFLVLTCLAVAAQADTKKALFLGNGMTFANSMPQLVEDLALPLGDTLIWEMNTPQGFNLQMHASDPTSIGLIEQGDWDFVILQEQEQLPALEEANISSFINSAQYLVEYIRNVNDCAVPMFFLTPAFQDGDEQNCADWPPVCTYSGMQELLSERYLQICDIHSAWCSPVGEIWSDVLATTDINLYDGEGTGPSLEGSYLIASTMYVAMFGQDPITSVFEGGIDQGDSQAIRAAVWSHWEDEPDDWKQYGLIEANIIITGDGPGYNIEVETSSYVDSVVVSDGVNTFVWFDGSTSFLFVTQTTNYEATAYSSCTQAEVFSFTIEVEVSVQELLRQEMDLWPVPARDELYVRLPVSATVELLNLTGSVARRTEFSSGMINWDVGDLPRGLYVVRVQSGDALLTRRLVLQ